jgi:hypothetical protein
MRGLHVGLVPIADLADRHRIRKTAVEAKTPAGCRIAPRSVRAQLFHRDR